jgi:hypothetical protein
MSFQTTEPAFHFRQGTRPLLISMPHVGTHVPPALAARLTDEGQRVPDTDWHLERLYDFADELGASVLVATHSRFVIDLNRPPTAAVCIQGKVSLACARWICLTINRCTATRPMCRVKPKLPSGAKPFGSLTTRNWPKSWLA